MNKLDKQIMRNVKRLAQRECANYADGSCLKDECPCYAVNPAHGTVHNGAIGCDYFLKAVQPTDPELNTAIWHEIFREEGAAGEGWKAYVRCHKPFLPASNHQRYCAECGTAAKQTRRREKQHRYRARKNIPAQRYLLEQKKARKNKISRTPRRVGRYIGRPASEGFLFTIRTGCSYEARHELNERQGECGVYRF